MIFSRTQEILTYDGTIEGYFTILYHIFLTKRIPEAIVVDELVETNLFSEVKAFATVLEEFTVISKKIEAISEECFYYVYTAFLNSTKNKEMMILKYIFDCFKYKKKINQMKHLETVIAVHKLERQVTLEAHRLKGFLRFQVLFNDVLYAEITPDHNVLSLIIVHFKQRFMMEKWMIHDKTRGIICLYDSKNIYFEDASNLEVDKLINSREEEFYQQLWKDYFENIAIKERTNKRCQLLFMPRRYWKNMLETKGS